MPPKKVKLISSVDTAKKTDDDLVFNALPMPNATTAGLLTVDLKTKYATIYNVFKAKGMAPATKVNSAWVGQHVNAVRNYITETYTEPNTLYGYLNWLGNILLVLTKTNTEMLHVRPSLLLKLRNSLETQRVRNPGSMIRTERIGCISQISKSFEITWRHRGMRIEQTKRSILLILSFV